MAKKIKLMQITHDLAIGGLQQVILNICKSINRDRFEISVLCLRNLGEYVEDVEKLGVKVHYLEQKSGTDYFAFLRVAKLLRENEIDIIHTHNTQPFVDGTIGGLLAGVRAIIHTDHARDFPDKRRYMFAEWVMSLFAFRVVGVSEHTSNNLNKYEKISRRKLQTITNGIDISKYDTNFDIGGLRDELGLSNADPVIGICARLSEQKGIIYLLEAMPELIKKFPNIVLVIAGKGKIESELKQASITLGVSAHTRFIGPRLDIPKLLKLFDLYVLPSLYEGLPMTLLEAMAAKCPIVASDVGGNRMAITPGVNGALVPPKDHVALSKKIIEVLNNKSLQESFINNGYDIVLKRFSAQIMTSQYEHLYMEAFNSMNKSRI